MCFRFLVGARFCATRTADLLSTGGGVGLGSAMACVKANGFCNHKHSSRAFATALYSAFHVL